MKHRYQIRVPSFLCRPDDQVGFDGMASLFQEAAWQHAERLGVDFTDGSARLYWVLHRVGMRFSQRPRWNEAITITTWPSRMVRLYAMREFLVHNDAGELLLDASSAWIVLDGGTGRPVRPEQHLSREWTTEEMPFSIPTGRLPTLSDPTGVLAAATWDRVRPSDIDRNAHVNNARYVQWLSDWAPELVSVEAPGMFTFTAETRAGQEFAVISGEPQNEAVAEVWVRDPGAAADTAVCACRFNRLEPEA